MKVVSGSVLEVTGSISIKEDHNLVLCLGPMQINATAVADTIGSLVHPSYPLTLEHVILST
jgi:hypothetical protein